MEEILNSALTTFMGASASHPHTSPSSTLKADTRTLADRLASVRDVYNKAFDIRRKALNDEIDTIRDQFIKEGRLFKDEDERHAIEDESTKRFHNDVDSLYATFQADIKALKGDAPSAQDRASPLSEFDTASDIDTLVGLKRHIETLPSRLARVTSVYNDAFNIRRDAFDEDIWIIRKQFEGRDQQKDAAVHKATQRFNRDVGPLSATFQANKAALERDAAFAEDRVTTWGWSQELIALRNNPYGSKR